MKHGFLPILGIYSPGLYLIITHSRNKSICYCGFGTELLFAENLPKITYFWIRSNPASVETGSGHPGHPGLTWFTIYPGLTRIGSRVKRNCSFDDVELINAIAVVLS